MCDKRRMSQREASELVNYVHGRRKHAYNKRIPRRAYYCETCKAWHTTSQTVKEFKES